MCLETVDPQINKKICKGFGWKVFSLLNGEIYGDCAGSNKVRPRHKWLNEAKFNYRSNKKIKSGSGKLYPRGWHIFTTKEAARKWNCGYGVLKVKYRIVLATGQQGPFNVIIAKWIRIGQ